MKTKSIHSLFLVLILLSSLFTTGNTSGNSKASSAAVNISSCQTFPANNFWNVPIDNLPVHPSSAQWINSIGAGESFHMDFGSGTWNGGTIGIPYNIVSGALVNEYEFDFYYPDESDPGLYPLPATPQIEWGSDHHILVVDTDDCKLYEVYDASFDGGQWNGGSGAIWDLDSNNLRPDTWTSADAAGLPILPGLARYDEISAGVIEHALRFTANCTANYYIWPARHKAQHGSCATPVPFGARFRLKADYDISGFSPQAQILLQAFKTYGIVLADNGSDWYVSGSPSESWDNDQLHELDVLAGSNFEAVDTSGLMIDYDSGATGFIISGNMGIAGGILNYMDGTPKAVTSQADGSYSFAVPNNWSGTVTPSHTCHTFDPTNRTYSNIITNQITQDYTATLIPGSECVLSITRVDSDPTSASSVHFTATFSEDVTGVNTSGLFSDFVLTTTSVNGATITNVSGSGTVYTVTVNTGTGNGTIRLDVVDDDSIRDLSGNPLGGVGWGNGDFISGETYTITKVATFEDVPNTHPFWQYIEAFYNSGITVGCSQSPRMYCPDNRVTRGEMAVFIERAMGNFAPVPSPTGMFADLPYPGLASFTPFIEEFYNDGITVGCLQSPLTYCPQNNVTRGEMAVFIERAIGNFSPTPSPTGMFSDLPYPGLESFTPFIEEFYNTGVTVGCIQSPLRYCPQNYVTRGEMAVFIVRAFGIPLP